jgi:hypothetical protein
MTATTSSFVSLGAAEGKVRDYHVIEDTGRSSAGRALLVGAAVFLFLGPFLFGIAAAATRSVSGGAVATLVVCGLIVAGLTLMGHRISGILTVTDQRLIYYRRQSGMFGQGHSYMSVWLRDICGVITFHERSWGKERVALSILTARSNSVRVASGSDSALARLPLVGPLFDKDNQGPDAARALKELPALLPELRLRQVV